jgi:hypothetical protein
MSNEKAIAAGKASILATLPGDRFPNALIERVLDA